ncbi:UNVERIFIED_CONTAM: hypothetical protein ABIC26_004748 [Paenibacillus sp. PvR008]
MAAVAVVVIAEAEDKGVNNKKAGSATRPLKKFPGPLKRDGSSLF